MTKQKRNTAADAAANDAVAADMAAQRMAAEEAQKESDNVEARAVTVPADDVTPDMSTPEAAIAVYHAETVEMLEVIGSAVASGKYSVDLAALMLRDGERVVPWNSRVREAYNAYRAAHPEADTEREAEREAVRAELEAERAAKTQAPVKGVLSALMARDLTPKALKGDALEAARMLGEGKPVQAIYSLPNVIEVKGHHYGEEVTDADGNPTGKMVFGFRVSIRQKDAAANETDTGKAKYSTHCVEVLNHPVTDDAGKLTGYRVKVRAIHGTEYRASLGALDMDKLRAELERAENAVATGKAKKLTQRFRQIKKMLESMGSVSN